MKIEKLKLIYDFQMKSLTEATNVLAKGMTLFFAILAVLAGYIISQDTTDPLKEGIVIIAIAINFFALIAGVSIGIGVYQGIETVKKTLKTMDKELWKITEMDLYFKRGKRVVIITCVCCALVLISMLVYLVYEGNIY